MLVLKVVHTPVSLKEFPRRCRIKFLKKPCAGMSVSQSELDTEFQDTYGVNFVSISRVLF